MPIISKTDYPFENGLFKRIIKVDSSGEFSCNLPPFVAAMVGSSEVTGHTKPEVEGKFGQAIKTYLESQSTILKVICYRLSMEAVIIRNDTCLLREEGHGGGLMIRLQARVFNEKKTLFSNGKVRFDYEPVESNLPHSLLNCRSWELTGSRGERCEDSIAWTPVREEFFIKLGTSMENFLLELHKLKSPQDIISIADTGAKLLT